MRGIFHASPAALFPIMRAPGELLMALSRFWIACLMILATLGAVTTAWADEPANRYLVPEDQPDFSGQLPAVPEPPASFNTHDAGWILFAYPPAMRERLQPLIRDAAAVRDELRERLGHPVLERVRVYVARTPGEMATLAPEGAPYPKYASGVAYSDLGLVLLTIASVHPGANHDLGEVFRHELAHVALHDALGGRGRVPRWFNEGFAVHASGESSVARLQTLWTATLAGNLRPLRDLENAFPTDSVAAELAYAQSADVVRFLLRQEDRARFGALIGRIRNGQTFDAALRDAYGLDMPSLEFEWREEVAKRYSFWPVFFSGSIVWMGALGLFVVGWRRRKRRSDQTLERWRREEALEDARTRVQASPPPTEHRLHILLPSRGEPPALPPALTAAAHAQSEGDVPKVEHDGQWHTLH